MSISNELESVVLFIQNIFPTATFERQNIPDDVSPNLFVVSFHNEIRTTETRFHTKLEREWQFAYFGESTLDVLDQMDKLSKTLLDARIVIPIKDSLRYIRINTFAISEPFQTENKIDAIMGVLVTETREARSQDTFDKIMSVSTVIK
jgi:hypothetical protein